MAEVIGRQTDFLVRADGTMMHALAGIYVILAFVLINAMASLLRSDRDEESLATILAVLLNCGMGYLLFVLATMGGAPAHFGPAHLAVRYPP